jgi:hypothetical protein
MTDTALDDLPQLETIFDQPKLNIDEHVWKQNNYFIVEQCHEQRGIPIPNGSMLVNNNGHYSLVNEITRKPL